MNRILQAHIHLTFYLESSINNVDSVGHGIGNVLLYETTETRQVGRDRGNAHDCTLGRSVAPRLVVGGENAQMAASDKIIVADGKQWTSRAKKFRMENDFDAIGSIVEELRTTNVLEHQIGCIVDHVVSDHGRKRVTLGSIDATFKLHNVLLLEQVTGLREIPSVDWTRKY